MGPSLWDTLYGTPSMPYGTLSMGPPLWDTLYGTLSMGHPLWDPLYGSVSLLLGLLGLFRLLGLLGVIRGYGIPLWAGPRYGTLYETTSMRPPLWALYGTPSLP